MISYYGTNRAFFFFEPAIAIGQKAIETYIGEEDNHNEKERSSIDT